MVETFLFDADTRHPAASEIVGRGSFMALAPGRGLLAHRESGGTLHTYAQLLTPQNWVAGIDFAELTTARCSVVDEFDGWATEITALITDGDTPMAPRPIYTLPSEHRWDRVPGATLVGDAAHLTAPNGEGANVAMHHGAQLGMAIAAHSDDVETALVEYENAMFPRAAAAAAEGIDFQLVIGDDAPHGVIALWTGADPASSRATAD